MLFNSPFTEWTLAFFICFEADAGVGKMKEARRGEASALAASSADTGIDRQCSASSAHPFPPLWRSSESKKGALD